MRYAIIPSFVLGLVFVFGGCAQDSSDGASEEATWVYQNLIFSQTSPISAAQSGDIKEPAFSWTSTGYKHVVCAIFKSHIAITNNQIVNEEELVWIWHSGLDKGRDGNISFVDGVTDLSSNTVPEDLSTGTYYWAVWAIDEGGHVRASSTEYALTVQ
jgi:hypothetical protein